MSQSFKITILWPNRNLRFHRASSCLRSRLSSSLPCSRERWLTDGFGGQGSPVCRVVGLRVIACYAAIVALCLKQTHPESYVPLILYPYLSYCKRTSLSLYRTSHTVPVPLSLYHSSHTVPVPLCLSIIPLIRTSLSGSFSKNTMRHRLTK